MSELKDIGREQWVKNLKAPLPDEVFATDYADCLRCGGAHFVQWIPFDCAVVADGDTWLAWGLCPETSLVLFMTPAGDGIDVLAPDVNIYREESR